MIDAADCVVDEDRGPYIATASGKPYWPFDPKPEDIRPFDLAVHLSRICRFNGALDPSIPGVYSVAQHCCIACDHAPTELKLEALLHDAHEAYVHDIAKPIKLGLDDYNELERLNERVMRKRFGLPKKMTPEVKTLDRRLFATEVRDLMPSPHETLRFACSEEPLLTRITPWVPQQARQAFLERLHGLWSET
jgi:hypothetical protein